MKCRTNLCQSVIAFILVLSTIQNILLSEPAKNINLRQFACAAKEIV